MHSLHRKAAAGAQSARCKLGAQRSLPASITAEHSLAVYFCCIPAECQVRFTRVSEWVNSLRVLESKVRLRCWFVCLLDASANITRRINMCAADDALWAVWIQNVQERSRAAMQNYRACCCVYVCAPRCRVFRSGNEGEKERVHVFHRCDAKHHSPPRAPAVNAVFAFRRELENIAAFHAYSATRANYNLVLCINAN